jgi:hypothetical protein
MFTQNYRWYKQITAYALEKCVMKKQIEQNLSIERRVPRNIFSPCKVTDSCWRIKTDEKLDELIKVKNILIETKFRRISRLG